MIGAFTLRDLAVQAINEISKEYGPPSDRDQAIVRWMRHLVSIGNVPDDLLETMPEISRHNEPQDSPQEYECGCLAITRITDRNCRIRDEKPFEMRLAMPCDGTACELGHLRTSTAPSKSHAQ